MKQLLAAILLAASLAATVHGAIPERPNIIVLLADDLRRDPLEMTNLVADPAAAARLAGLRGRHASFQQDLK